MSRLRSGCRCHVWPVFVLFLAFSFECASSFVKDRKIRHIGSFSVALHSAPVASAADTRQSLDVPKEQIGDFGTSDESIFSVISKQAVRGLLESDMRRDAKGASTIHWFSESSASDLRQHFDRIKLKLAEERSGTNRDEASTYIRWYKSSPAPLVIDLSKYLRDIGGSIISDREIEIVDQRRQEFLSRLGCRLVLLPSGAALQNPFQEPPASIIYGKLLYGGVTRYRLLESSNSQKQKQRRAGERTDTKPVVSEDVPAWNQYGGPARMFESVDMGPAAILELILLPKGQSFPSLASSGGDMFVSNAAWSPEDMFDWVPDNKDGSNLDGIDFVTGNTPTSMSGKKRNDAFRSDFELSVGGLQPQIDSIVRRVLDGRVIRPAAEGNDAAQDGTTTELSMAAAEAEELAALGLTPVKGLLLYGPPGCGKTALAREISKALRARAPKIVSAPELLDRWVGGSEKLVRALFSDAEAELAACGGDPTKSALHVIVIDEIDAVFRHRSGGEDSGEATRASVVNQILSKLDGIDECNNLLIIGMTNRKNLIDPALLRPGRLEVQIEIPLPDADGRREIMNIHFGALRQRGRLSGPLCCAISGVPYKLGTNNNAEQSKEGENEPISGEATETVRGKRRNGRKRRALKRVVKRAIADAKSAVRPAYDLAADSNTGGFSGADIAGLVRNAGSIALSRSRRDGSGIDGLTITLDDVKQALEELK